MLLDSIILQMPAEWQAIAGASLVLHGTIPRPMGLVHQSTLVLDKIHTQLSQRLLAM
jgi:hypothetical protein